MSATTGKDIMGVRVMRILKDDGTRSVMTGFFCGGAGRPAGRGCAVDGTWRVGWFFDLFV